MEPITHRLLLACAGAALAVTLVGCGSVTTTTTTTMKYPGFACTAAVKLTKLAAMPHKGMCVDDTTFWHCPDKMTGLWPNTNGQERVGSLRLFAPWKPEWGDDDARQKAWANVKTWLATNNGQVLLGTSVTCDVAADDQMWKWSLEFINFVGQRHIMGIAVGNEMDIFFHQASGACNTELWNGRYWETLQARVADVDKLGMTDTKITSVWAMSVLADAPWKENGEAKVNTLMTQAYKKWGKRWVWSFNVYAIWDAGLYPTGPGDCKDKTSAATHISYTKAILKTARQRIKMTTGNDDDTMWVGENGWSSPMPDGHPAFAFCPDYGSLSTLQVAYQSFMSWDLTLDDGLVGPEHAFYFTMRDANNIRAKEYFGLIAKCSDTACKIHGSEAVPGNTTWDQVIV